MPCNGCNSKSWFPICGCQNENSDYILQVQSWHRFWFCISFSCTFAFIDNRTEFKYLHHVLALKQTSYLKIPSVADVFVKVFSEHLLSNGKGIVLPSLDFDEDFLFSVFEVEVWCVCDVVQVGLVAPQMAFASVVERSLCRSSVPQLERFRLVLGLQSSFLEELVDIAFQLRLELDAVDDYLIRLDSASFRFDRLLKLCRTFFNLIHDFLQFLSDLLKYQSG